MTLVAEPAVESGLSHRKPFRIPGQGILLANVALVLVGLLILDVHIFSRASLSTLTPTIGVMILMALGQAFIIGTGGIDLSIPSTTTLVGAIVLKEANGDNGALLAAVAMALVVCIGIGLVNGLLVEVTRLDALVVTLATGQLIAGVTRIYRGPVLSISTVPSDLSDFARSSVGNISIILILAIAVAALIALWMKFHTSGRRLAASSVARPAAENSGLAAARQRITAWMAVPADPDRRRGTRRCGPFGWSRPARGDGARRGVPRRARAHPPGARLLLRSVARLPGPRPRGRAHPRRRVQEPALVEARAARRQHLQWSVRPGPGREPREPGVIQWAT